MAELDNNDQMILSPVRDPDVNYQTQSGRGWGFEKTDILTIY